MGRGRFRENYAQDMAIFHTGPQWVLLAALIIAPSLALLFTLDQRSRLTGHGVGSDVPTEADATTPAGR